MSLNAKVTVVAVEVSTGKVFVKACASSELNQRSLDAMIEAGNMPQVIVPTPELAQLLSQLQAPSEMHLISENDDHLKDLPHNVGDGAENSDTVMDDVDHEYFTSYGDFEIHKLMLQDRPRTEAYIKAITSCAKNHIKDKVVLDVGTGTGVLAMFAAKAGARKVFAVEASDLANLVSKAVRQNGLEGIVEVIHGKMEDITLPEHVDTIISEWMGFYLVHESMLSSVINARDRYLKPGGILLPSIARILAAPASMPKLYSDSFTFWNNKQYGLNMSAFADAARAQLTSKPFIDTVESNCLLSPAQVLLDVDLSKISNNEVTDISGILNFRVERCSTFHGYCMWFDVAFRAHNTNVILDTSPNSPSTHWKQTLILFGKEFNVEDGESLSCKISLCPASNNCRQYTVSLETL